MARTLSNPRNGRRRCANVAALAASLLAVSSLFLPVSAQTGTTAAGEPPLDDLVVSQFRDVIFIHGVDFEWAQRLGPGALPTLRMLLTRDDFRPQWAAIIWTIAYIGAPEDFETLRAFLWERFDGEVDSPTYQALLSVPNSLGAVPGAGVVNYLAEGADPKFWTSIKWWHGRSRGERLHILLSRLAINGLSHTGSQKARDVLKRLSTTPYSSRQRSNIREGLVRNDKIASKGLAAYIREQKRITH